MCLFLAACGSDDAPQLGTIGFVEGFAGAAVADEPRAALVGRDILASGGSAGDAAVAMYFAMAVTLPSQASLGGGGVCLAFDSKTGETKALDFLARAPVQAAAEGGDRPTAVPGNPRGFFALHGRYGRLRWAQVVAPAENLAIFGVQVSRAFGQDLRQVEPALLADWEMRRVFGQSGGSSLVREQEFIKQPELGTVLASIGRQGPGDFYAGSLAGVISDAAKAAGGTLSREDLRNFRPQWRETIRIETGNDVAHFPVPPPAGGLVAGQIWGMLVDGGRFRRADADTRDHLLAETALRAFGDRGRWLAVDNASAASTSALVSQGQLNTLMASYRPDRHVPASELGLPVNTGPENPAAASVLAVDASGSAVACSVTLNSLFGTGRIAPGTGIVLASLPGAGGRGATALGPMMVVNENVKGFRFAAAASGGVAAPTALTAVAARSILLGEPLRQSITAARVHVSGDPDLLFIEPSLSPAQRAALSARGHRLGETPTLGRVQAIACPGGLPANPDTCAAETDPRGFGLAVIGN